MVAGTKKKNNQKTPPLYRVWERSAGFQGWFFEHWWITFATLSLAHLQESNIGKVFNFFCLFFPFPFPFPLPFPLFSFLPPFPSLPFSSFLLGTGKKDNMWENIFILICKLKSGSFRIYFFFLKSEKDSSATVRHSPERPCFQTSWSAQSQGRYSPPWERGPPKSVQGPRVLRSSAAPGPT